MIRTQPTPPLEDKMKIEELLALIIKDELPILKHRNECINDDDYWPSKWRSYAWSSSTNEVSHIECSVPVDIGQLFLFNSCLHVITKRYYMMEYSHHLWYHETKKIDISEIFGPIAQC